MEEKIKNALLKIANEIIDFSKDKSLNEEDVFYNVEQLHEVLSVYRFLKRNKITNWEIQEKQLNSILYEITGNSKSEDFSESDNSKLEVEPLIETIKDMVTEMPENQANNDFFSSVSEAPIFVEKNLEDKSKESKIFSKKNINDKFMKGLHIDLNDRLAFIKHLFSDNKIEYQRVISQITTFSNIEEVTNFIHNIIKPEYNNWKGKEDYEKRFFDILSNYFA